MSNEIQTGQMMAAKTIELNGVSLGRVIRVEVGDIEPGSCTCPPPVTLIFYPKSVTYTNGVMSIESRPLVNAEKAGYRIHDDDDGRGGVVCNKASG